MRWQALIEKFNALNERERLSVMVLLLVSIAIVFAEFLLFPISDQYDSVGKNILAVQSKNNTLKNQIIILKAENKAVQNPKERQQKKLKLINEQIANVNLKLKENMRGLIAPKEMAKVLEFVLSKSTDLQLHSMQALESKPLVVNNADATVLGDELGIYHHGMRIHFSGSYLSMLTYLQALNDLPWDFYWDDLDLTTEKYPISSVVLTIHTLSFHKDWIGV